MLFYNGVTLGAVAAEYIGAGQTQFLFGWLLSHGVIEISAILVAGQAVGRFEAQKGTSARLKQRHAYTRQAAPL